MTTWAARLPVTERSALARLRSRTGLRCAVVEDSVWMIGPDEGEIVNDVRRWLPAADHFAVLPNRELREIGLRVPLGTLPEAEWEPVSRFVDVRLPLSCMAGRCDSTIPVGLIRSAQFQEPSALLTRSDPWSEYAIAAPELRLRRWRFAACIDRRALIVGSPLPSITGERLVVHSGIAVPAGWEWSPRIPAEVLCEVFGLQSEDILLLRPGGQAELIRGERFVAASRSAVRASAGKVSDG